MGMMIRWDVGQIIRDLRTCAAEVSAGRNDGFTQWHCKQDLLQVKYMLDNLLKTLPTFVDEEQYIRDLEKQQVWRAISKK